MCVSDTTIVQNTANKNLYLTVANSIDETSNEVENEPEIVSFNSSPNRPFDEYIYLIREREFVRLKELTYKIGKLLKALILVLTVIPKEVK